MKDFLISQAEASFADLLSATGMQVQHTGGGCLALVGATTCRGRPDGTELLATSTDGLLPETEYGPWNLGEYGDDDEPTAEHANLSREQLIAKVAEIRAAHEVRS